LIEPDTFSQMKKHIFSPPVIKYFLTHLPQDSETFLEAIFKSRIKAAQKFTLPERKIFMHRKKKKEFSKSTK